MRKPLRGVMNPLAPRSSHAATRFGLNIVVRPRENPYRNQQFALPPAPDAGRTP